MSKGFTLIELIVVIGLVGVMFAIVFVNIQKQFIPEQETQDDKVINFRCEKAKVDYNYYKVNCLNN